MTAKLDLAVQGKFSRQNIAWVLFLAKQSFFFIEQSLFLAKWCFFAHGASLFILCYT
jgi:hypothetical protein